MSNSVLITGASKGIGLATSMHLANNGYKVVGIARSKMADNNFPGDLFLCDLASEVDTATVILKIRQQHKISAIINNVGIASPQALGQIDLNTLTNVYQLNVRAAVQITQGFLSDLKEFASHGRVINISSRAIFGVKDRSSYAAAKSALIGLTRTWALELAEFGVTVNAVSPGPVETELFRKTRPVGSQQERDVLAKIPLARLGKPEEIAATIAFLLSDGAAFITGQNICVDGGGALS